MTAGTRNLFLSLAGHFQISGPAALEERERDLLAAYTRGVQAVGRALGVIRGAVGLRRTASLVTPV